VRERASADQAASEQHWRQRVLSRYALRQILAGSMFSVVPGENIRIGAAANGKPYIVSPADAPAFNVSHCDGWALIALSHTVAVGVDLERLSADRANAVMEGPSLTADERDSLQNLSVVARGEAALAIWTQKEALAKGLGLGLGLPFTQWAAPWPAIRGTAKATEPAWGALLRGWTVGQIIAPEGYVAALATQALDYRVRQQHFDWRSVP
jgi:4'-phosphopantetheinyl transferase